MNEFNIGDVVRVLSGGPMMTIQKIDHAGDILAVWFDVDNHLRSAYFPAAVLRSETAV